MRFLETIDILLHDKFSWQHYPMLNCFLTFGIWLTIDNKESHPFRQSESTMTFNIFFRNVTEEMRRTQMCAIFFFDININQTASWVFFLMKLAIKTERCSPWVQCSRIWDHKHWTFSCSMTYSSKGKICHMWERFFSQKNFVMLI